MYLQPNTFEEEEGGDQENAEPKQLLCFFSSFRRLRHFSLFLFFFFN